MPLPFAIPAMISGFKHWKLLGLGLILLALAVQTLRLDSAQERAKRFKAERDAARAELVAISTAKDEQKTETGRNIEKARSGESDARRVSDRIRNAPVSGKCETPKEILQADL